MSAVTFILQVSQKSQIERELNGIADLIELFRRKSCNPSTDFGFGDGLDVIKVDRTLFGHAVCFSNDFTGNFPGG